MSQGSGVAEFTFLFADLSGFTALTEAHGDLDAAAAAMRFYELARDICTPQLRLVKTMGDAVMLVSRDPAAAAEGALRLLGAVDREHAYPAARAGLHLGPAVEQAGDYFGAAVNLAARIAAHAAPGQVLASATLARVLAGAPGLRLEPLGEAAFRNVAEPVALCRVCRAHVVEPELVTDPVCRMRLRPEHAHSHLELGGEVVYFCSAGCAEAFARSPERFGYPSGRAAGLRARTNPGADATPPHR